jgi:DNA adenine methylase
MTLFSQNPRRPALRYHGGKFLLAPWIIQHFPEHRTYVEPFAGAASVLLRKPRSYAEIYNDRWDEVVRVFRVLRDPVQAAELEKLLRLTPFARTEFDCANHEAISRMPDLEAVRLTVFRSFAGFGSASTNGKYSTGFRCNSNRSGTTPAQDWMHFPDCLKEFTQRLQGVVIENKDAIEVIQQHDCSDALFYVDPPYPHSTRNMQRGNAAYECEMSDGDHRHLAEVLQSLQGRVLISGYACELYDRELYADWHRVQCDHLADGARPRTEVLWANYSPGNVQLELSEASQ